MDPKTLKPMEDNLFSLATEMGLVIFSSDEEKKKQQQADTNKEDVRFSKPYSHLT